MGRSGRLSRLRSLSGLVALVVVAAAGALSYAGAFATLDARLADRLFISRPARSDIVIVAIDDRSIQAIGRWPWPRSVHAKLLDALASVEPAVVVFDVAFFESSNQRDDGALATAMGRVPTVLTVEAQRIASRRGELVGDQLLRPIPAFLSAAAALGHVHTPADPDGVVRAFPGALIVNGERFESLSAAALSASGRHAAFRSDRISFAGPAGTIRTVSYADVLEGRVPAAMLQHAFIFVGATAPNLHDAALTPTSRGGGMAGVELHAHIADQILQGITLAALPRWVAPLIILALGLLIVLTFPRNARLWHAGLTALAFGLSYNAIVLIAFSRGIVMSLLWPNVAIAGVVVGAVATEYLAASRERKFIRETFSRYVSPDVVSHLLERPELVQLGGELKTLTILFSDIRGFTSLSEQRSPHELTRMLNRYLTNMSAVVMALGGVLDKYIGDAMLAFWGAPIAAQDHAAKAGAAALQMIEALRDFNQELEKEGWPKIAIGIGINTGEVIVGNMGSEQRFDYTVIGDAVNLASRLEGLNKVYGTTALVAAETERLLPAGVARREIDRVAVKGKAEAVAIYELLPAAEAAQHSSAFRQFAEGLAHYRQRRWDEAVAAFQRALELKPGDGPAEVFLKRIEAFRHSPPPPGWDGTWQAESK